MKITFNPKLWDDKDWHVIVCAIISLTIGILFTSFLGLIVAITIGALKELVWDKLLKKGTPSWQDFVADLYGSFLGFIISLVVNNIHNYV